jgi:hypothetical protein
MAAGDKATALLKGRVKVVAEPDSKRVGELLDDLDADKQAVREAATRELRRLGRVIEAALRQRHQDTQSVEVRSRLKRLLEEIVTGVPESTEQIGLRVVTVLEQIGTPAALCVLKELATGSAESDVTRNATSALRRVERLADPQPARDSSGRDKEPSRP